MPSPRPAQQDLIPREPPGAVPGLMQRSWATPTDELPWWPLEGVAALAATTGRILTVFDLETAGGRKGADAIVEIHGFCVSPRTGQLREFGGMVNPERPISWFATQVHGLTRQHVADAPNWAHWVELMHGVAAHHLVSGYNSNGFDCRQVMAQNARYGCPETVFRQTVDTLHVNRAVGGRKGGLGKAAAAQGVPGPHAHRARDDALMTLLLLDRLIDRHGVEPALGKLGAVRPKPGLHPELLDEEETTTSGG